MAVTQVYAAAAIPDDYSLSSRIFGLYPLSAPFVLRGVHRLHRKEQAKFYNADAIATRTTDFTGYRIADSTADQLDQTLFSKLERDALGIPIIKTTQLSELFRAYAPIWLLEEQSRDDRIATVVFANDGPGVNTNKASLYTYVSYARFAAKVVTQLNYVVWFAARPKQGFFDILGGAFDSITYRVTLDEDGEILLIDTMHSCGCYYMAFPSRALKQRETQQSFSEPLWVPYAIDTGERRRFAIVLSATRHYVRGVGPAGDIKTSRELIVRSYDDLKQLAFGADEFVNLFAPDGLVAASARSERFLLWPMGIASPGAMRVAGHHAIAFVGRRHFDDPDLLDRFFERIK